MHSEVSRMKILVISDEVWNDDIHGNNVLTNWFDGFNADFANIYCSPGIPKNNCCKKYFQITDKMMVKSIFRGEKAGKRFELEHIHDDSGNLIGESENKKLYRMLKRISTESLKAIREAIWCYGKYDIEALTSFIDDFKPDIIFSPRMATLKILRLENTVLNIAKVPIVAFTGDAEYSLKLASLSPVFWIKRIILRSKFRRMMPNYSLYYTSSDEQRKEYAAEFGDKFRILRKCAEISENRMMKKEVSKPIRIVYVGKLYCNRWKTLREIVKALRVINENEPRLILDIYTKDRLSNRQKKSLHDNKNSFIRGSISSDKLQNIYDEADIALHVESFDLKNRLLTRVSFSTKIVDCLASGCAVMVVSWNRHSGYLYLNRQDAAIAIGKKKDLLKELTKIAEDQGLVSEYVQKAKRCCIENHSKQKIQSTIAEDFRSLIKKTSGRKDQ